MVYAALAGNVLVTLAKFGAAALSGSGAMLTEAIHSSADSINQLLLLVGNRRSKARPDASHPFGYGLEIYFWTFVVAVMVLIGGGAVSITEGVHKLGTHEPVAAPAISLGVLAVSAVFEAASFAVGFREYRRIVRGRTVDGRRVGVWRFIEISKDPNLYESLLEDFAALVGLGIAAVGVAGSAVFGLAWADGAASIAIGLLLIANSIVIARATQSLIAGEAAVQPVIEDLMAALRALGYNLEMSQVRTLQLGPRKILLALTLPISDDPPATELIAQARRIAERLRAVDDRITDVLFDVGEGTDGPS